MTDSAGLMDSLVAALRRQMLDTFPDTYIPDRDQLGREPMDPLVGRYLEEELDRRVDQELNRLAYEPSDWVSGERRDFVDRAHRNLRASITAAVSFPASRWESLVDQATRVVCSFVARPVTTAVAELFQLGADSISGSMARSRLRALAGHPEIAERADRWLAGAEEPIRRGAFAHAIREIAESVISAEEFWVTATDSLFALHQRVNGKRAVPPARLRALYDDLGLRHLAERIADVEAAGLSSPWTESMLLQAFAIEEEALEPPTLFDVPAASPLDTSDLDPEEHQLQSDFSDEVADLGVAHDQYERIGDPDVVEEPRRVEQPEFGDLVDQEQPTEFYAAERQPVASEPTTNGIHDKRLGRDEQLANDEQVLQNERVAHDERPEQAAQPELAAQPEQPVQPGRSDSVDPEDDEDGVPLWRRFQSKLNAPMAIPHPDVPAASQDRPHSAGTAAAAAASRSTATDTATTEKSTRPLWERYRKPVSEIEISTESPADFVDLEQFVLGPLDNATRTAFVETLFNGRPAEYREMVRVLAETETWPEATTTIANEVFRRNRVNIYSEIAIRFTNAVERRFKR